MIYMATVSVATGTQFRLIVEAQNRRDAERIAEAEVAVATHATVLETNVVPVDGSAFVYDIMGPS